MKTDQPNQSAPVFLQSVSVAVAQLKQRLQQAYEQVYPDLRPLIQIVLEQEEARAWDLTSFPHLLFPDLVEAHLGSLNMHPMKTSRRAAILASDDFNTRHAYKQAVIFYV